MHNSIKNLPFVISGATIGVAIYAISSLIFGTTINPFFTTFICVFFSASFTSALQEKYGVKEDLGTE